MQGKGGGEEKLKKVKQVLHRGDISHKFLVLQHREKILPGNVHILHLST